MQALALEEAETKIRRITKDEFFSRAGKAAIDRKVYAVIRDALKAVKIPALRTAAEQSLLTFYNQQYEELRRSLTTQIGVLAAFALLQGKDTSGSEVTVTQAAKARAWQTVEATGYQGSRNMGVPMQVYIRDYIKEHVKPALDRLVEQEAKDPDDITGRNSLRNRAEFEVRGQAHKDTIDGFRARGVKLVICSTHSDCSERCAPYQGRVYSLDGTSGTTDDGRQFVPLEEATNNPKDRYITKAGRVWQNGLLGFNCRHFLVEYQRGYEFPEPDAKEEARQYAITETQRRLERNVRKWRTKAVEYKGSDPEAYKEARAKAIEWNKRYIEYSKRNKRAFYPSRTTIL